MTDITLNRVQAQAILDYIDQGESDVETEVIIGYREAAKDIDGEDAPAGVYMWDAEYPEEGSMYLDKKSKP